MAQLKVKLGVQPRLVDIIAAIGNVAQPMTIPAEIWITSAMDSIHSPNSLHYALRAADVRTKNFPSLAAIQAFANRLREELGPAYQVIYEDPGGENQHLHIEFDPS